MRLLFSFPLLLTCLFSTAQTMVYNLEPGRLTQQIGSDSALLKSIADGRHLRVNGTLAKEDVHYIAALARQHHIKHLDLSKTQFREIGFGLFENCDSLCSIALPATVRTIAKNAFKDCIRLEAFCCPKSLTSIGSCAFYGCKSLQLIEINNKLSWIGKDAFAGCRVQKTKLKGKNKDFFTENSHLFTKNKVLIY